MSSRTCHWTISPRTRCALPTGRIRPTVHSMLIGASATRGGLTLTLGGARHHGADQELVDRGRIERLRIDLHGNPPSPDHGAVAVYRTAVTGGQGRRSRRASRRKGSGGNFSRHGRKPPGGAGRGTGSCRMFGHHEVRVDDPVLVPVGRG